MRQHYFSLGRGSRLVPSMWTVWTVLEEQWRTCATRTVLSGYWGVSVTVQ